MAVLKVIEVLSSSPVSWEDAAKNALAFTYKKIPPSSGIFLYVPLSYESVQRLYNNYYHISPL